MKKSRIINSAFQKGALLFITSDGLIEECSVKNNQQPQYGLNHIAEFLDEKQQLTAEEIINEINQDFETYSSSKIGQDDITYMIFKQK